MTETPFTIAVPDDELELLQKKLELTRLPDELDGAGWDYGVPRAHMERLLARWKDGYDWRAEEAALNRELPMFTRDISIDGHGTLNVHHVHQKSKVADAIPLLFVHGWPGSFIEVRKILPMLVAPEDPHAPAFNVVALGLPGYGFSEAPKRPGFGPKQMAETGHKLMLALGYDEYVCQGGDWGCIITQLIASLYGPRHAKAWHTNMPMSSFPNPLWNPIQFFKFMITPFSAFEKAGFKRSQEFMTAGNGYFTEQSTKPQTLGYNLSDSPAGLLAWIYEKLVGWTDDYAWTDDEVLTWISIYWFSKGGPTASTRLYYEYKKQEAEVNKVGYVKVPTGVSFFPKELLRVPSTWLDTVGNVVQKTQHERGGHFAAHEVPELLAEDLRKMFGKGGPAYRAVKSKSGYE